MEKFEGDLSKMWSIGHMPPKQGLTWDWWWWLVMLRNPDNPDQSKQLMTLWSTKDTPYIEVDNHPWIPEGTPNTDSDGGMILAGMVAAWYFDGEKMWDPIVLKSTKMLALNSEHKLWSGERSKGDGAIIPICEKDLSMGLENSCKSFWLKLESDDEFVEKGAPKKFDLKFEPWNKAVSTVKNAHKKYSAEMGYDILRIHGALASGKIDGEKVSGTAYFQKVCVQAPSPPWYWGMLHFSDGSYLDWFVPHIATSLAMSTDKPWSSLDSEIIPLSTGGLFHDIKNDRTEVFSNVKVKKTRGIELEDKNSDHPYAELPHFEIEMWNSRTTIVVGVQAISRAKWNFDQPTRGGIISHLTYNEYPLKVTGLAIDDSKGIRTKNDWEWITGNAEHSWGLLH